MYELEDLKILNENAIRFGKEFAEKEFEPIQSDYMRYRLIERVNTHLTYYNSDDYNKLDDEAKRGLLYYELDDELDELKTRVADYRTKKSKELENFFKQYSINEDEQEIYNFYYNKFTNETYIDKLNDVDRLRMFFEELLQKQADLNIQANMYYVFFYNLIQEKEVLKITSNEIHRAFMITIVKNLKKTIAINEYIRMIYDKFKVIPGLYKVFITDTSKLRELLRVYNRLLKTIKSPVYYTANNFNPSKKAIQKKYNDDMYQYHRQTVTANLDDLAETIGVKVHPTDEELREGKDDWPKK